MMRRAGTPKASISSLAENSPSNCAGNSRNTAVPHRANTTPVGSNTFHGEREKSPEARLKEKDKRRAAYYRFYTDMNWGNAANYHIALDSGVIGIEKSAEIIESLA